MFSVPKFVFPKVKRNSYTTSRNTLLILYTTRRPTSSRRDRRSGRTEYPAICWIFEQMEKDGTDFVWEDMRPLGEKTIMQHFPNIYQHCIEEGFDPRKEPIPVVPAQHYFMGGIQADLSSRTSMRGLYACGETSCNGVHGKNRLASNSLLESLVFARRAADDMIFGEAPEMCRPDRLDLNQYEDQNVILEGYHKQVLNEIERMKKANE